MTGTVTWDHLVFWVGVITAAILGTTIVLWKVYSIVSFEREHFDLRFNRLVDRFVKDHDEADARIGRLEIFHAGLVSVLKQMDEFRSEVREDFEQLRNERKDDMKSIHARLDQLLSEKGARDARRN